eukprot:gene12682-biopygen2102
MYRQLTGAHGDFVQVSGGAHETLRK